MFRQIGFEWRKIFRTRLFVVLFIILFLLNGYLFLNEQKSNQYFIDVREDFEELELQMKDIPREQVIEEAETKLQELENIQVLIGLLAAREENAILLDIIPEETWRQYQDKYNCNQDAINKDALLYSELLRQIEYQNEYLEYIDGMGEEARRLSEVSIFHQKGTFSYRNILKTPKDFEYLKETPLVLGNERGIVAFSNFVISDLFLFLLIFEISYLLFWKEKELGLRKVLHTTVHGRRRLGLAKIWTNLIVSVALVLLFYGTNVLLSSGLYGLGDLSRYVQSMQAFSNCNFKINVAEYIVIFLTGKIVTLFSFSLFIAILFWVLKNSQLVMIMLACVIGGSYLAYHWIPPLSVWNWLKYINPIAVMDTYQLLTNYCNINIFGFPFQRSFFSIVLLWILSLIALHVVICFFQKNMQEDKKFKLLLWLERTIEGLKKKIPCVSSLFLYEIKKVLIKKRLWVVFLILFLVGKADLLQESPTYTSDEIVYLSYMETLEGELTEEKEKYMREERAKFDQIPIRLEQMEKELKEGTLSQGEYEKGIFLLDQFEDKEKVFREIEMQYSHIKKLSNQGYKTGFVNKISSDYFFAEEERIIKNAIWVAIAILVFVCVIYGQEYKENMIWILNPTNKGKEVLFANKLEVGIVLMLISMFLYSFQYLCMLRFYPLGDLTISLNSIVLFGGVRSGISIRGFLILQMILQFFSGMGMVFICAFISIRIRNILQALLVSAGCTVFPFILVYLGVDWFRYFSVGNVFLLFTSWQKEQGVFYSGIQFAWVMIAEIFMIIKAYLIFCNRQRRWKNGVAN